LIVVIDSRDSFQDSFAGKKTDFGGIPDLASIKHDGYRMIVHREGQRVRLLPQNGYDWSHRYPLIVEAAIRNRAFS
jgi:ATP-dependent DNA ligase